MPRYPAARIIAAILPAIFFAPAVFTNAVAAAELVGPARAAGGASLFIAGQLIRLQGLDAPPLERICTRNDQLWRCGEAAAFALAALIERHWLTCQTRTQAGDTAATCRMGGSKGIDIGQRMVRDGWARSRPGSGYEQLESQARQARRGLWAAR